MTIIIKKNTSTKDIKNLLSQLNLSKKRKSMKNFYGKSILNIENMDAVEFQKKLRNEWD